MTSAADPQNAPATGPVPAKAEPLAVEAATSPGAIYDPAHVPETSEAYRETPMPHRLSVPDYTGAKFFRLRRLIVLGGALALVPLTLFSARPWIDQAGVTQALTIAGYSALALGLLFRLYATLHIAGAKGRKIVDTGPYAMVRHPLYFGSFLSGCGIALLTGAPVCWAAFLVVGTGTYLGTIVFEERRMAVDFPGVVNDYRARVAMLFPTRLRLQLPELMPPGLPILKEALTAGGFLAAALAIQSLVWSAQQYQLPAILRFW
ncbi:MAG TPA: isoprenylcysteine carboxylmethyltransferase family protein [Planctomycetota bacterium]|nr:isoprenylcysteine carboxylmethyltransferase family protein [Planctomycetota bacterium]